MKLNIKQKSQICNRATISNRVGTQFHQTLNFQCEESNIIELKANLLSIFHNY